MGSGSLSSPHLTASCPMLFYLCPGPFPCLDLVVQFECPRHSTCFRFRLPTQVLRQSIRRQRPRWRYPDQPTVSSDAPSPFHPLFFMGRRMISARSNYAIYSNSNERRNDYILSLAISRGKSKCAWLNYRAFGRNIRLMKNRAIPDW